MLFPAIRSDATPTGRFLRKVEAILLVAVSIYFLVGFALGMEMAKHQVKSDAGVGNQTANANTSQLLFDFYSVVFEPANKPFRYVLPKRGLYKVYDTPKGTWYLDAAPAVAGLFADMLIVFGFSMLRLVVLGERASDLDKPYEPPPVPREQQYTEGINLKMEEAASKVCGAAGTGRLTEMLGALPPDTDADPKEAAVEEYQSALAEFVAGDPATAHQGAVRALDLAQTGYGGTHIAAAYAMELVGHCALEAGDVVTARQHYQNAAAIWNTQGGKRYPAAVVALDGHGRTEIRAGRNASGVAALKRARTLLSHCGTPAQQAETARGHADFLRRNGLSVEADAV